MAPLHAWVDMDGVCSSTQTLAQCTGPMNSDMWNAYHIISNRARSVCYAVRQQQFRRQTEMAVNRLSDSTMEQLVAVQELASNHREIREMAAESLGAMHSHQEALLEQQQQVVDGHQELKDSISSNLNELASEKSLIKLGQQQLSELTESIKKQLGVCVCVGGGGLGFILLLCVCVCDRGSLSDAGGAGAEEEAEPL